LTTDKNIQQFRYTLQDSSIALEVREEVNKSLAKMEANKNKVHLIWPSGTIQYDRPLPMPKRVAIIANWNTMSAAEVFILRAKQSNKVVTYGANTYGTVDFLDMSYPQFLPCNDIIFYYPLTQRSDSGKMKLDGIGISPDVNLVGIKKDWIKYVQDKIETAEWKKEMK
jgi:C-terminal processing protease CtpA/Prc